VFLWLLLKLAKIHSSSSGCLIKRIRFLTAQRDRNDLEDDLMVKNSGSVTPTEKEETRKLSFNPLLSGGSILALIGLLTAFFNNGGVGLLQELMKSKAISSSPSPVVSVETPISTPSPTPPPVSQLPSPPVSSPIPSSETPSPIPTPTPIPSLRPTTPSPSPQPIAQIFSPSADNAVSRFAVFSGSVKNLPNDLNMWLYVKGSDEGKYYFHTVTTSGNDHWNVENVIIGSEGSEDVGAEFEIGIVLANASESAEINSQPDGRNDLPGRRVTWVTVKRQ
jgi:hypothetical protein